MKLILTILVATYVIGQIENATPIAILRQINNVNDDGSYTFGYEAADGTFKVENRDSQGNVKGKYGYLDETGLLKTVEYSAGGNGFVAAANHLPVGVIPQSVPVAPSFRVAVPDNNIPVASEPFVHNANFLGQIHGQFSHNANSAPHLHHFAPSPATFLQMFSGYDHSRHQNQQFGFTFSAPYIFPRQQFVPHPFARLFNGQFFHQ